MIIGLTGKSCSGKDTVASLLDDNFRVVDVDRLGHEALGKNIAAIRDAFGDDVVKDGVVDRKKLGPLVFSDGRKLEKLNSITHPWMVEKTLDECHMIEKEGKTAVINAALLESMGFVPFCSEIILVISPYEKRLERAVKRDNISEENFKKRTESQENVGMSLFSSGKSVVTIINDKGMEELSRQVSAYCAKIERARVK